MPESKSVAGATPSSGEGASPGRLPDLSAARRPPQPGGAPTAEDEAYEIRIGRDGTWYYHGSPIGRIALVKLFSTVLRRDEAGDYWLVTPAERGRITVEDAPFVAVEVTVAGSGPDQALTFRTNLDEQVTAGPDHPIRVVTDPSTGEPHPYILVRGALEARINRPVFYQLVELAEASGDGDEIGVWSTGTFFPLGKTT
ncbi:DUF1285 domain-containing protein [Aerophototrophica crusticola]|uniref:DUF1285 domain-containing protein n=1 Tax=Aerophototrophica crusticola TaxID=1709002 RepID=A0A858R9W6_9PROT|nr:DUF1285 domain-containing protein [Rhodospirillaceae bacterium B3]